MSLWSSYFCRSFGSLLFLFTMCVSGVSAQDGQTGTRPPLPVGFPLFYIHAGVGAGLARMSSEDIEEFIGNDYTIASGNFTGSYSGHVGISNIVQYEYRKSDSGHNVSKTEYDPWDIHKLPTLIKSEMDYDTWDNCIKVNPFIWTWAMPNRERDSNTCLFLLAGEGTVEYFDKVGDGFTGDTTIFGVEYAYIVHYVTAGVSLKRYLYRLCREFLWFRQNVQRQRLATVLLYLDWVREMISDTLASGREDYSVAVGPLDLM